MRERRKGKEDPGKPEILFKDILFIMNNKCCLPRTCSCVCVAISKVFFNGILLNMKEKSSNWLVWILQLIFMKLTSTDTYHNFWQVKMDFIHALRMKTKEGFNLEWNLCKFFLTRHAHPKVLGDNSKRSSWKFLYTHTHTPKFTCLKLNGKDGY